MTGSVPGGYRSGWTAVEPQAAGEGESGIEMSSSALMVEHSNSQAVVRGREFAVSYRGKMTAFSIVPPLPLPREGREGYFTQWDADNSPCYVFICLV